MCNIKKRNIMSFLFGCIIYVVFHQTIVKLHKIKSFKWQTLVCVITG